MDLLKKKKMSSLVIIANSTMEDYNLNGQDALTIYKRFRVIISEPKSRSTLNRIESAIKEEAEISKEIDVLFWNDISKEDILTFSEKIKKINEKINCHHFISENLLPKKI